MKVSVIFSTYNSPVWLEKVLWGFFCQTNLSFEIVIADDGSTVETTDLIRKMRSNAPIEIKHVWQCDDGFQKCRILNKAIVESSGDYLIFTDGDCIPRTDFVEQHVRRSQYGVYLSGGYFKLPMSVSQAVTKEDVSAQRVFDARWLKDQGLPYSVKTLKLLAKHPWSELLNIISPARATWNGHNASCHKDLILAVNGFDERMQYGGEDREFGERLLNYGVRAKRIRYSAVCVHLEHRRGYVTEEMLRLNLEIRKCTRRNNTVRAALGIDQYI